MEGNKFAILIAVIEAIVFLIPLLKVVWSFSHAKDIQDEHEKRITNLEQCQNKYQEKIGTVLEQIKDSLNKISNTLDLLDLRVKNLEKEKDRESK